MKTSFLIIFFLLAFSLSTRANMDCIWTSSKAGVTIRFIAPCDQKYKSYVDSLLNNILKKINRKDTTLQILVLINDAKLSYPDAQFTNFTSIGFDTLRQIDDEFVSDYYFSKNGDIEKKFSKRFEPLDINATLGDTIRQVGIKIIYRRDYKLGEPDWTEIQNLILYATQNLDLIKKTQIRNNVRYDFNGWYVSLMSIDTLSIKKIIQDASIQKKQLTTITKNYSNYQIWGIVGLLLIIALFMFRQNTAPNTGFSAMLAEEYILIFISLINCSSG